MSWRELLYIVVNICKYFSKMEGIMELLQFKKKGIMELFQFHADWCRCFEVKVSSQIVYPMLTRTGIWYDFQCKLVCVLLLDDESHFLKDRTTLQLKILLK